MNQIYLFGHQKPDTDSITSVIGYVEFKNRSEPGRYVPTRCGEVNPETRFMLERYGLEAPVFMPLWNRGSPISCTSRCFPSRRKSRRSMSRPSWQRKVYGT